MHVNIDFGEGQIDYAHYKSSRIRKQKYNTQTLKNKWFDLGGIYQRRNKLKLTNLLELLFNIECVFCTLVCFGLLYLFSPLHHIKETIWQ